MAKESTSGKEDIGKTFGPEDLHMLGQVVGCVLSVPDGPQGGLIVTSVELD